jgi:hypothetical protein
MGSASTRCVAASQLGCSRRLESVPASSASGPRISTGSAVRSWSFNEPLIVVEHDENFPSLDTARRAATIRSGDERLPDDGSQVILEDAAEYLR